jgi:hypothetical protein
MSDLKYRIKKALAVQGVEEVKTIHAYLHAINYSREEWDTIWSKNENSTWAHRFGRMVGPWQIYYDSVVLMDIGVTETRIRACKNCPDELMDRWFGIDMRSGGSNTGHILATPVIEVADDLKTARSYYLTPGGDTCACFRLADDGKRPAGNYLWERYGSDFIYEDGRWLYLHEQVCPDMTGDYTDINAGYQKYCEVVDPSLRKGPPPQPQSEDGKPPRGTLRLTDPGPLHEDYTIVMPVQKTVIPPKPYATMDDENTYAKGYLPK